MKYTRAELRKFWNHVLDNIDDLSDGEISDAIYMAGYWHL